MGGSQPSALLRPGLLDGVRVVLAGGPQASPDSGFASSVGGLCERLGGSVARCEAVLGGVAEEREAGTTEAVQRALAGLGGAAVLIVDAAGLYELAPGADGLDDALQATWDLVRALANGAFIPGSSGGRIFLLSPRSGAADIHAAAAAAGLENLARTLSVEWARYAITIVAIAPGGETSDEEVASVCAWLASPAGDYFSGCLMDLRGPRAAGA